MRAAVPCHVHVAELVHEPLLVGRIVRIDGTARRHGVPPLPYGLRERVEMQPLRFRRLAVGGEEVRQPGLVAVRVLQRDGSGEAPPRPVAVDPPSAVLVDERLQGEKRAFRARPAPGKVLHPDAVFEELRKEIPRAVASGEFVEILQSDATQRGVERNV